MNSCEVRRCDQGELLLVTSNGDAPNYVSLMGLYQMMSVKYNSAPAYGQVHNVIATKRHYIYKHKNGDWVAGVGLGGLFGLYNSNRSPAPPRSGWQYYGDGEWRSDPDLSIVTISDTSTLICPVITIKATGVAARERPDYLGQFTITNQFSAGRPVWRNNKGKYLLVHADGVSWYVGDNVETGEGEIQSGAAPGLCPASPRSRYNKRLNQNSWQYGDGHNWYDGDITVTCNSDIVCD